MDAMFDAGGKVSAGTIATTIVANWTWAATLLQSTSVTTKVWCNEDNAIEML